MRTKEMNVSVMMKVMVMMMMMMVRMMMIYSDGIRANTMMNAGDDAM